MIWAVLTAIWTFIEPIKEWVGLGLAGLGGLFLARQSGKNSEKAKQLQRDAKARSEADKIEDAVAGRTAAENKRRLSRWASK